MALNTRALKHSNKIIQMEWKNMASQKLRIALDLISMILIARTTELDAISALNLISIPRMNRFTSAKNEPVHVKTFDNVH